MDIISKLLHEIGCTETDGYSGFHTAMLISQLPDKFYITLFNCIRQVAPTAKFKER